MKPNRIVSPLFAACLAAVPLHSEEPAKAVIWKINDDNSTVYLAGSVHLLRPEDLPIPETFDKVYAEAEEIIFEIDMKEMSDPAAAAKMQKLTSLPEGEELADLLTGRTMKRLRSYLEESGKPGNLFDRSRPTAVLLLMSALEAERHGARPELGLESTFFKRSVADKKPSQGLETIEFQISLLDSFENHEIEKMLNEELDRVGESGKNYDEIVTAWKSGDGGKLAALLEQEPTFTPELRELLLTRRNRNWIPKIETALAQSHDFLFLVGSAHLVGEGSVVSLLKEKGLEVTQIENQSITPEAKPNE